MINYTQKDMIKKHETNIKAGGSIFVLSGILGLIYIVRYIIKKNFDFYFSLSFSELMLRLSEEGKIPSAAGYGLIGVFVAVFVLFCLLTLKNSKNLKLCLGFYAFDCICLMVSAFIIWNFNVAPEFFIDVILHALVLVFLVVGVKSERKIKIIK